MIDINALRNKLNNEQNKSSNAGGQYTSVFSFSKLNPGDVIPIRFIDDNDELNNSQFWVQRHVRTLSFNNVKLPDGSILNNKVYVTIPAFNLKSNESALDYLPEEYLLKSDEDLVQQQIKPLFVENDPTSLELYHKFKKRVNYVYHGFVRAPGYETKLYRFIFSESVHNLIRNGSKEILNEASKIVTDQESGFDFNLRVSEKTISKNGRTTKMKDYSSSSFARSATTLTEAEKNYLATTNISNLKDYTFKKPTTDQMAVMLEMFRASLQEEPYDVVKWGKVFKPDNLQLDANGFIKSVNQSNTTVNQDIPPVVNTQPQPQMVYATMPATFSNPVIGGEQQAMQQMAQQYTQPMSAQQQSAPNWNGYNAPENKQMLVDSPVAQQSNPTAPTIAAKVTETVNADSASAAVSDIMARLMGNN